MKTISIAELKNREDLTSEEIAYVAQRLISKGYKGAKNDPTGIGTALEVSHLLEQRGWKEAAADGIGWEVAFTLYPPEER